MPQSELVRADLIEQVKVVRGDVRDQSLLERTLGEYEIDTVLHLAAQTIVGIANRNPVSTFETNIAGTWSLLEACRRSPAGQTDRGCVVRQGYGDHEELPYSEARPSGPASLRREQVVRGSDRADLCRDLWTCRWPSRAAAIFTAAAT